MTETIEVRYMDVSGSASFGSSGSVGSGSNGTKTFYHKYIVYTDSEGNQFAARSNA